MWALTWGHHPTGDGGLSKLPSSNTLNAAQLFNSLPWEKWGRWFLVSALASGESQQTSGCQGRFLYGFRVTRVKGTDKRGGTPDTVGGCFL